MGAFVAQWCSMPIGTFEVTDAIAGLNWDLNQIKVLHQALNEAMKREVVHLLSLGDAHATMREEVL